MSTGESKKDSSVDSIFTLCETCHWCATYFDNLERPPFESPSVLFIAGISNKVNHVFNMTLTNSTPESGITRRKAQQSVHRFSC